jgi:tetratricopeptide (TPR) repeat protein/tRNA A-37 threonylcarbamoyl transferase component Bud32
MTPERWQAAGDLFEQAIALPLGDRSAFVNRQADDDEVRSEVLSLLASHHAAGSFVQEKIRGAVATFYETGLVAAPPSRVGPYRLIRELGRGGMGTVFLAERDDDEYHARVAVKLVRPGMDTEFILARFRRERQTLARLQHPNISRLLDGGTTETGLPYIVMEYIDGPWLTAFADQRRLGIDERLRLFLDVCSAVDYAHRHFIVHRDLKPGNILVGPDGAPKLLDFGICKLLQAEPSGTDTVAAPMTPNYASPEQVRGDPATLLSDIYSLGAVLYELLTGSGPRQFDKLTPRAIEDVLSRTPIARPSAIVRDKAAARQLSGDLDNVVMRALETEPERRYESAAQFADDLKRFLDNEPVRARPQTLTYRLRKFVRRNRLAVAATAAVFVALSAGLLVSMYEARIAASRLQQVRTLASKVVFDVHDAVRDLPGSTKARRMIVQTGLDYLDSLVNSVAGDSRAETELAKAYRRLGDVQGNAEEANLGDVPNALADYRKAMALVDAAIKRSPQDFDAQAERVVLYERMGALETHAGKLPEAIRNYAEGIRTGSALARSGNVDLLSALGNAYLGSNNAKRNAGDFRGALDDANESLRVYRDAAARQPNDRALGHSVSNAYASLGMAESMVGQLQDGLAHFRLSVAEMEKLAAAEPQNVAWQRDLMLAYGHVADVLGNPDLQNLGDRDGAVQAYRQAAEIGKKLYEADPADQRAMTDYGIVLSRVETMMDNRDPAARLAVQTESMRVLNEAARLSPTNVQLKLYVGTVQQHMGDTHTAAGNLEAARQAYLASKAISEANIASGHLSFVTLVIQIGQKLALNAVARARRSEAIDAARATMTAAAKLPSGPVAARSVARGLSAMGLTYAALGRSPLRDPHDADDARAWLQKASNAWHASASDPTFAAPHRREMRDVDDALANLQHVERAAPPRDRRQP